MALDPNLVAQVNSEFSAQQNKTAGLDPKLVEQVNNEFATQEPAPKEDSSFMDPSLGSINAASQSLNTQFEQVGRGLAYGAVEAGNLLGLVTDEKAAKVKQNLQAIYDRAQKEQAELVQQHPVAATVGGIVGQGAMLAGPSIGMAKGLAALGGEGLLAQSIGQGAVAAASEIPKLDPDLGSRMLQSGILGTGATIGVGLLGQGVAKTINAVKGNLTPKGEAFKAAQDAYGFKPRNIDFIPSFMRRSIQGLDVGMSGADTAISGRVKDISNMTDDILANAYSKVNSLDYAQDAKSLIQAAANKNNFAAQQMLKTAANDTDLAQIVSASGNMNLLKAQQAYDDTLAGLYDKLGSVGGKFDKKALIDSIVDPIKYNTLSDGSLVAGLNKTGVTQLEQLGKTIQERFDGSPQSFQAIKKNLEDITRDLYDGDSVATYRLAQNIKKSWDAMENSVFDSVDPILYKQLRDLKGPKAAEMQLAKDTGLVKALERTDVHKLVDDLVNKAIKNKDQADFLYKNVLEPKGQAAFKAAHTEKLFQRIQANMNEEDWSKGVTAINNALDQIEGKKYVDNVFNTFYTPEERSSIIGALKVMKSLEAYKTTAADTPTGKVLSPLLKGAAGAAAVVTGGPVTAAALGTGAWSLNRLMNSAVGSKWLAAASQFTPGSPEMSSVIDHLMRISAAAAVTENSGT